MHALKTVITTLIVLATLAFLAGFGVIYTGVYNVAATDKHLAPTAWALDTTVANAVAKRARGMDVPDDLGNREQLYAGINNYSEMCAGCHAPPGGEPGPVARGLYPEPTDLRRAGEHMSAAELFWVVKHGIKATGMPAWGPTHSDKALWSIVALVQRFPAMDGAAYATLKEAARDQGGHHGSGHDDSGHGDNHQDGSHSPEAGAGQSEHGGNGATHADSGHSGATDRHHDDPGASDATHDGHAH